MILSLRATNPLATIIVTSRPDERFNGWHQFDTYSVKPLTKVQVVQLIRKAPYDSEHKSKFLSKVDKLFETHETFLTTPLLAYMMLLTFSYNQDIPKKMFLFYEQAFEALYTRHDLTKGGFKRKLYTGLERQELMRLISYFCLKSYYDQEYEFTDAQLNKTIDDCKKIEGHSCLNHNFISDLSESLCLLKRDGIVFSFTHRSFQEYFAANCLARVANRNLDEIFNHFSRRHTDSVFQMVYDINLDLFRGSYILPMRAKYSDFFSRKDLSGIFAEFSSRTELSFHIMFDDVDRGRRKKKDEVNSEYFWSQTGEFYDFFRNIKKISKGRYTSEMVADFRRLDLEFCKYVDGIRHELPSRDFNVSLLSGEFRFAGVSEELNERLIKQFYKMGIVKYMTMDAENFYEFINAETAAHENVTKSFSELF